MRISQFYQYSWFSNLAYVEWAEADGIQTNPVNTEPEDLILAAHAAERIPGSTMSGDNNIDTLGERIFQKTSVGGDGFHGLGWQLLDFHTYEDSDSGFAASLYDDGNEKVLAIRGTYKNGVKSLTCDSRAAGFLFLL